MSVMYKTCPDCGAHLDPGERCDCSAPWWKIEYLLDGETLTTCAQGRMPQILNDFAARGLTVSRMERADN
jgi:glucokinase